MEEPSSQRTERPLPRQGPSMVALFLGSPRKTSNFFACLHEDMGDPLEKDRDAQRTETNPATQLERYLETAKDLGKESIAEIPNQNAIKGVRPTTSGPYTRSQKKGEDEGIKQKKGMPLLQVKIREPDAKIASGTQAILNFGGKQQLGPVKDVTLKPKRPMHLRGRNTLPGTIDENQNE